MTDVFAYHAARDQMADLRRAVGQSRLQKSTQSRLLRARRWLERLPIGVFGTDRSELGRPGTRATIRDRY